VSIRHDERGDERNGQTDQDTHDASLSRLASTARFMKIVKAAAPSKELAGRPLRTLVTVAIRPSADCLTKSPSDR
jgi:hypothetical protein